MTTSMSFSRTLAASLVAVCALAAACSDPGEADVSDEQLQIEPRSSFADGMILAITAAVNRGELRAADLAVARSDDARVVALANEIASDHQRAQARQDQLALGLRVTPVASGLSLSLGVQSALDERLLRSMPSTAFDRVYVETQIAMHTQVLALLDAVLVPMAVQPGIRTYLVDLRAAMARHREHARRLRLDLLGQGR
jgi:putative membrane protein